MVPLNERSAYLQRIEENAILLAFKNFLLQRPITKPQDLNEIDTIYYGIIESITTNEIKSFDVHYEAISRRIPTKDSISPFVHNDYLIFAIITGIIKFNYRRDWISKIISIRTKNDTTITFENIIEGNIYSKNNIYAIVISCLDLSSDEKISKELQDDAYQEITQEMSIFDQGKDLIALCSMKVFDMVVQSRDIVDKRYHNALINFETKFVKRSKLVAGIMYNIFLIVLIYCIYKTLDYFPEIKQEFSDTITIIGFVGIALTNFISGVRNRIEKIIYKIFGYSDYK